MPSNRGPRGNFCCTDNGIQVGCINKSKAEAIDDVADTEKQGTEQKCSIF